MTDRTHIGRRSARLGSTTRQVFRPRQGRDVVPLNQGSSTLGHKSVLSLNQRGGSFGSGRPAGGASALTEALMGPSVVGAPEVDPPPVTPLESLFSMESPGPLPPSYLPPELAQAWETNTATYPTSADYVTDPTQGALSYGGIMPRKWGSTWRFPS